MGRTILAMAAVAVALFCLLLTGAPRIVGAQNQGQSAWSIVEGASAATDIQDVVMIDRNNAWAVGIEGDAGRAYKLEAQDGHWRVASSQAFSTSLRAVAPISDDNVWA